MGCSNSSTKDGDAVVRKTTIQRVSTQTFEKNPTHTDKRLTRDEGPNGQPNIGSSPWGNGNHTPDQSNKVKMHH